jgi:hypothetical protein
MIFKMFIKTTIAYNMPHENCFLPISHSYNEPNGIFIKHARLTKCTPALKDCQHLPSTFHDNILSTLSFTQGLKFIKIVVRQALPWTPWGSLRHYPRPLVGFQIPPARHLRCLGLQGAQPGALQLMEIYHYTTNGEGLSWC